MIVVSLIAYLTSLVFKDDPTLCIYDTEMMRRHLYKSLMSGKFTPFPQKLRANKVNSLRLNMILRFIVIAECQSWKILE